MTAHLFDNKTRRCQRCGVHAFYRYGKVVDHVTSQCVPRFVGAFSGGPYDGQTMPLGAAFEQLILTATQVPGPNVRYALVSPAEDGGPLAAMRLRYTYLGQEPERPPPPPLPERPF